MLNTGSKNYLISLRESNLLPCSGGKVHVTVQISLAESVRLNNLVKNLILDDTHPSVFPKAELLGLNVFSVFIPCFVKVNIVQLRL